MPPHLQMFVVYFFLWSHLHCFLSVLAFFLWFLYYQDFFANFLYIFFIITKKIFCKSLFSLFPFCLFVCLFVFLLAFFFAPSSRFNPVILLSLSYTFSVLFFVLSLDFLFTILSIPFQILAFAFCILFRCFLLVLILSFTLFEATSFFLHQDFFEIQSFSSQYSETCQQTNACHV